MISAGIGGDTDEGLAETVASHQPGFTRASALGPIADFVDHQGGSITRVLNDVDMPFELLESPDMPVPLTEQFRLLERAARETGDPHFGARLGRLVRIENLSAFGKWVSEADDVADAIDRSNRGLNVFLQTGTVLKLERHGEIARWSIEFLDPGADGRYQNELLGLSYLIDVVRCFTGRSWAPDLLYTTTTAKPQTGSLEQVFEANVSTGNAVPCIEFPASVLSANRARPQIPSDAADPRLTSEPAVPGQDDGYAAIAAVTSLALLEGYPRIDWVASKLGITRRSLQRRLRDHGTTFTQLLDQQLLDHSNRLLAGRSSSITEIALRLGYSDPAHFSRAYKRWTGRPPSVYRRERG